MTIDTITRAPIGVAALLLAVAVGACAIQLRGGDDQAEAPASATQESDARASELARCRRVNYEQREELLECRKIWAEKRRQFLSQRKGATPQVGDGASANWSGPSTGVIDQFLETFTRYIDSGFGLLGGEVAYLATTLAAIDIVLAGLFWSWGGDEDIVGRLVKKTLFVGVFAYLIGNWNSLARI
ncbi:hypothetical protein KXW38_000312, partial [Aspergillus fumigatus]